MSITLFIDTIVFIRNRNFEDQSINKLILDLCINDYMVLTTIWLSHAMPVTAIA